MKLFEDNFENKLEWNTNIRSKEKFLKNLYPFVINIIFLISLSNIFRTQL